MSFTIENPSERPGRTAPRLVGEPSPQLVEYDAGPDLDPRPDLVTVRRQISDSTSRALSNRIDLTTLFDQSSFYRKPRSHFALSFDGIDDYVEVAGSEYLDSVSHEFTCEVWFRPESRIGGHRVLIHYPFLIEYRGGIIRALWHPGIRDEPWIAIGDDGYYSVNRWHHVALAYSAYTSWATLYVNGRAADTVEVPPLERRTLPWYFAGHSSQQKSHNMFQGLVDEVRLWDRELDRQALRQNMYEIREPGGLLALWDFTPTADGLVPNLIDEGVEVGEALAPGRLVGAPTWLESTRPRAPQLSPERDYWRLREAFVEARSLGQLDETVFSGARPPTSEGEKALVIELFTGMTSDEFVERYLNGDRLVVREDPASGDVAYTFGPTESGGPYLFLEEEYSLTSFAYRLGAGRVLRAITLLPGEETKLRILSPAAGPTGTDDAACILDSCTAAAEEVFEALVAAELTTGGGFSRLARGAKAGSDGVRAGIARVNATRERFGLEVLTALGKHVAAASSRRTLHIETGNGGGMEKATVGRRSINNPNEGRTLHYVFRQLSQEYLSVLSLVDVKIGVGYGGVPSIVAPLHQIDLLLETFVLPFAREEIRRTILERVLGRIPDYRGAAVDEFVENRDEFWCVGQVESAVVLSPGGDTGIKVPGVILGVRRDTLRNEDVVAEGLLGTNPVLDVHTRRLEHEKVRERQLINDLMAQEIDRERIRFELIQETAETREKARILDETPDKMAERTDADLERAGPIEAEARERLSELREAAKKQLEVRASTEDLERASTENVERASTENVERTSTENVERTSPDPPPL